MSDARFANRHVLVVGERLAAPAQEALGQARFEIAGADRLDFLGALHGAMELVLIDADATDGAALVGAISALAAAPKPPAVMLLGGHLPAALVRVLMKLPRSDVLEAPFTPANLARAAATLLSANQDVEPASGAKCWTVIGSVGGCGATTIALETAIALSRRLGPERRMALVDLNLVDGALASYLGAAPTMRLASDSASPERIDASVLDAYATRVGPGLDLLASARDPRAFAKVSRTAVCRMLEVACQVYDWLIVDLARHHQTWTLDVLSGSDEILVVSELTVPALLAARSLASEIETELAGAAQPRIILNRLASRVFGPAPSLAEAERALQRKADGGITSDWEAAAASVNLGGSISHHRPRSKIVRDIGVLVDRLLQAPATEQAKGA